MSEVQHQLWVMRHAHAAQAGPGVPDAARGLTAAGREAARARARRLVDHPPGLVLCSAARRAVETMEALGLADVPTSVEQALYTAGPMDWVSRLGAVEASTTRVLLIGHLPTVEQLVDWLVPGPTRVETFAPAAMALLDLAVPWTALHEGAATMRTFHG